MAQFLSRAEWGSAFPRAGYVIDWPVAEVYIHHFNSGITAPQSLADSVFRVVNAQRYHAITQGWGDIGYSWLFDDAGNIFEGRGWWRTGAHTWNHNSKGYGLCWLGDSNVSLPSPAALAAAGALVKLGVSEGAIVPYPTIVAHRDRVPDTACCGDAMYQQLDLIREAAWYGTAPSPSPGPVSPVPLPPIPLPPGEDDMTDEERAMLVQIHGVLGNQYPGWGRPPSINDMLAIFTVKFDELDKRLSALDSRINQVSAPAPAQGPSAADVAAEIIRQLR